MSQIESTRNGEILRRPLRHVVAGREVRRDTATLEEISVLAPLCGPEE